MRKLRTYYLPVTTFIISLLITFFSAYTLLNIEKSNEIDMNEQVAERHSRLLISITEHNMDFVAAVANFFQSTEKEDWYQFEFFARNIAKGSRGLVALEWLEKVDPADTEQHMSKVREKYSQASLYTSPGESQIKAGNIFHDERPLFIVSDIFPRTEANTDVVGFYPSRKRFEKVLEFISQTEKPYFSDRVTLLQDDIEDNPSTESDGFLTYYPVFDKSNTELTGIVIGVIRASGYLTLAVSDTLENEDFLIKITDSGYMAEDTPLVYQDEGWDSARGYETSRFIFFPNRVFTIHYRFTHQLQDHAYASLSAIVLSGSVISFLLASIVFISTRQKHILEARLKRRTRDLNYLVDHDPQTKTYNRRAFQRILSQHIGQPEPFSLITFDIDNFKTINDSFGHPTGDRVLTHVAETVSGLFISDDKLFRVGGDEFFILSDKNNAEDLKIYAEYIRESVEQSPLQAGAEIVCTVSIGAAVWNCKDDENVLIHNVDAELYKSKKRGRNASSVLGFD